MKKLYAILISLLLIFLPLSTAFASDIPDIEDENFCVIDDADVISQETENYLSALNLDLNRQTGASIVIATVDFTGSLSIDEYAYQAFNKWGVGDRDKDNGLLVLMSVGDEDYWAVQGAGIEKDLTSGEISQMLYENMEADFAKGDYDAAAKSIYLAAYEWFGDFYNVQLVTDPEAPAVDNPDSQENKPATNNQNTGSNFMTKIIMWIVIIAIVVILISALTGDEKTTKKRPPKKVQRKGPHTSSYRRPAQKPQYEPKKPARRIPFVGNTSKRSTSSSTRTTSKPVSRSTSRSTSTTSRSSSSGRTGGFGGGSTRGGGAGRRK